MAISPITTPEQAQQILDLSSAQYNTIRSYFGINDNPFQPDKTYIVFDADSGDNSLFIDTGGSTTYSISKGDGTFPVSYTDVGGLKILNYNLEGRYLITIEGTFNGMEISGTSADKNKYIEIIGGTNYPVSIVASAFESCADLISAKFPFATAIGVDAFKACVDLINTDFTSVVTVNDGAFESCINLPIINLPSATSIGVDSFKICLSLISANMPDVISIGDGAFQGDSKLKELYLPDATSIGASTFSSCAVLNEVYLPSITSLGASAFLNCVNLTIFKIKYTAGLTVGASAFSSVDLSDLYTIGAANGTEAAAVETKLTTAGMVQLNAYRLLY